MAKDKEPFEALTATAEQTAEQMTKHTQGAVENYFGWLQTTMSALPWSNTNLNRILLSHATQNVTATFYVRAKTKPSREFPRRRQNSNRVYGEIYTKVAEDAMKAPFGVSR